MEKILIIGAANIDLLAFPEKKLLLGDSNIGTVEMSGGGVGRNVAENLARLGNDVSFLTAFGNDCFGKMLRDDLESMGIDLRASFFSNKRSGIYLAIADFRGDLLAAVCENEIVKEIGPEYLYKHLDYINSFPHLFFDANLSAEALDFLFRNVRGKICIDATSVAKSKQFKPHLGKIGLLKGNRAEIANLSGGKGNIEADLEALLASGVEKAIATDGAKEVYFASEKGIGHCPVPPARIVSTNGAGDAFMSGVIHGLLNGKDFEEGIKYGIRAAQATLSVRGACNPDLKKYLKGGQDENTGLF